MKNPRSESRFIPVFKISTILSLILAFIVPTVPAQTQDLPATVYTNMEAIPSGSYVIPMDNVRQGNAGGTTFNKRAYGLANALLQAGVPLKWAIKKGKAKDGVDFTVNANKIGTGVGGGTTSGSQAFSGGPFIVYPGYETQALSIITSFNNYISGTANDVVVYQTTSLATVDVRYTLTHKPKIAVGSDNSSIHTDIFESALIPGDSGTAAPPGVPDTYKVYTDTDIAAGTCVTLVTQPHTDSPAAINLIKAFVQAGGNFFAQCRAVNTYENVTPYGQYQTNLGYLVDNLNSSNILYPNPDMPMNQFIGQMDGTEGGSERDWRLAAGSSFINSTFPIVTNNPDTSLFIATVSKQYSAGPGGMTFYLGSHEYDGTVLSGINAQRMLLNAVFQPPTRPTACGIDLGFPLVSGYKSVALTTDVLPLTLGPGDTLTWTIDYINTGSLGVSNFQISDILPNVPSGVISFVGPPIVTNNGVNGTTAVVNGSYTGASPNQNLLAPGAVLGVNGRITVKIKTVVNLNNVTFENQSSATGSNISTILSDNIDSSNTINYPGGSITAPGSIGQVQTPTIDPTAVGVFGPTAANASISGRVVNADGSGIRGAILTATNMSTGETRRLLSSAFGYYSFDNLDSGFSYVVAIHSKKYTFQNSSILINLGDSVSDVDFVVGSSFRKNAAPIVKRSVR